VPGLPPEGRMSLPTWLAPVSRVALWLAGGASLILGAIIGYDGLTGRLAAEFRAVTLVASLFFALVGLGFFMLERGLSTVRQFHPGHPDAGVMPPELGRAWRNIFGVLTLAGGGCFLVVCSGIVAVISRLRSGVNVFG
jgi:hypothetical protein